MKLLLSMLYMGFLSSGTSLRPRARTARRPGPRGLDFMASALAEVREIPLLEGLREYLADEAIPRPVRSPRPAAMLRRMELAQSSWGRVLLQFQVSLCQWQAAVMFSAPGHAKRLADIVLSALLLVGLLPLFLLIALAVKLEDGGPVFFAQTRVGRFGRPFRMFKVRSMCVDAEVRLRELLARNQHREGVTFKLKDDPRITRVGRWLRKLSLDELPQLFNVFLGDMSLVGPRPPVPREVAKYTLSDRRRLAIKPGITCIWQVSGRSEIDFSGQVKLDVRYIESQSFWLDLKLLARTLPAVISGRGAC